MDIFCYLLGRLNRDTVDMIQLIKELDIQRAVALLITGSALTGEMGKMVVTIMSPVEQAERCRLLASTNETSQKAKLKGISFGRRHSVNRNTVPEHHLKGYGAMEFARQLTLLVPRVIKILLKALLYRYYH